MKPYIGVTGFTTSNEITAALSAIPPDKKIRWHGIETEQPKCHILMLGILASWESLRGIPLKSEWQKRYPKNIREIKDLFALVQKSPHRHDVLKLIHYSCGTHTDDLEQDLRFMKETVGKNFDGFQLNIPWPDPAVFEECLTGPYFDRDGFGSWNDIVILQIGQEALEMAEHDTQKIASRLRKYKGMITGTLLDASGGQGKPFDPKKAYELLVEIDGMTDIPFLGIAGGLCAETLHLLEPLRECWRRLSIDAEGRLRDKDGAMDIPAMQKYIAGAFEMFSK